MSEPPGPGRSRPSRRPSGALAAGAGEALAIAREMLRIPAEIALRIAERLGLWLLVAWRALVPVLRAGGQGGLRSLRWAQRELTPARTLTVVVVGAVALLVGSQFADFRAISVGAPDYREVEAIAPTPQREVENAIWAHSIAIVVVAAGALVLLALALRGRWQLARLLVLVGVAVIALSLADVPKALDEGDAAIAYQGVEARLLNGFWAQLAAGVAIGICGPLLAVHLDPAHAHQPSRPRRRPSPGRRSTARQATRRLRGSRTQGARP